MPKGCACGLGTSPPNIGNCVQLRAIALAIVVTYDAVATVAKRQHTRWTDRLRNRQIDGALSVGTLIEQRHAAMSTAPHQRIMWHATSFVTYATDIPKYIHTHIHMCSFVRLCGIALLTKVCQVWLPAQGIEFGSAVRLFHHCSY